MPAVLMLSGVSSTCRCFVLPFVSCTDHGYVKGRLWHLQVFFAATGVSDGDLLRGVRYFSGGASTNSIVMRASSGTGSALSSSRISLSCNCLWHAWSHSCRAC